MAETDPITPGEGTSQTPANDGGEPEEELYTKAQLTEITQREIGKVTAKHSKALDKLNLELETEKRKSLPDHEKLKADISDRDKTILEREAERDALKLENAKIRALVKTGADPEKVDALLKRVIGATPEEIEADVAELKTLGLIAPTRQGLGTGTSTGTSTKPPSIDDEIADLTKLINDPKLSRREKMQYADRLSTLHTKRMIQKAKQKD